MSEPGTPRPPSVERLLAVVRSQIDYRAHAALADLAREVLASERARLRAGSPPTPLESLADELTDRLEATARTGLTPVINATGVILHTNLGRAPWPRVAIEAAREAAAGYGLLEMDRETGRRGPRFRAAEEQLIALTGAEDALVTNNNAAAVTLACRLAGRNGRVVVSRGELVEIGGGVRIPELIRRAGLRLVEVGTTNRTRLADYADVLAGKPTPLVLRIHASNFRMEGFVERPELAALAALAHELGALLVDDLGSGALLDTAPFGLAHEPTPQESLEAGADLVTFSGDKLLGGPQAGLIVGRAAAIGQIRRDPLSRATRPDKVSLAALSATLGLYRAGLAMTEIPIWRMIAATTQELRVRVERLAAALTGAGADAIPTEIVPLESTVGGGSLPGEVLPSWGLRLAGRSPDALAARLRLGKPCVMARIASGAVLLDLRTVPLEHDQALRGAIDRASGGVGRSADPNGSVGHKQTSRGDR